jgi:inosine-uridine nucleoside N-ribohydrolase
MPEDKVPVLLDTDIGSDIDDAVCLAYLLKQPRCELVGITTVTGEPEKRAMMADAMCRAAGRTDIPIHSGQGTPLLIEQKQQLCPQAKMLPRWEHRKDWKRDTAVEFMREVIHSRPGEITLLSIGPLTNVGLLFATDRDVPRLLKRHVLMCGVFTNRLAGVGPLEWNAKGDPHATAITYNARVRENWSIGLEVTVRCRWPVERYDKLFRGSPVLDAVRDFAVDWFEKRAPMTFHDPLAAATIFEPDLCRYEDGLVEVELKSDRVLGMTHFDPKAAEKPHRIAIDVDPERFLEHYATVTSR